MSAPDTNTEKQVRQHRGPLRGMALVVAFAVVLLIGLVIFVASRGGAPERAEAQVDGRTGATEVGADAAGGGAGANEDAADDGTAPASTATAAEDATAVTVAPETVTAPDSGGGNAADTDPSESQAAEPLDATPGDGDVAADAPAD